MTVRLKTEAEFREYANHKMQDPEFAEHVHAEGNICSVGAYRLDLGVIRSVMRASGSN